MKPKIIMKEEINRKFTGKMNIPINYESPETIIGSKQLQHFYDRMLRAYLRGQEYFHYGMEIIPGYSPTPIRHKVEYSLI